MKDKDYTGILSSVNTRSGEVKLGNKILPEKLSEDCKKFWDYLEYYRLVGRKVVVLVIEGEIRGFVPYKLALACDKSEEEELEEELEE